MNEVRRQQLQKLIAQQGSSRKLSQLLGYSNASFLTQMAGPSPTRDVTEKTARKIEQTLGLPEKWLDSLNDAFDQSSRPVIDVAETLAIALEKQGTQVSLPILVRAAKFVSANAKAGTEDSFVEELAVLMGAGRPLRQASEAWTTTKE